MHDRGDALDQVIAAPVTRRRMLQLTAVTGVSAFLAACGTAGTGSPSPLATSGATAIGASPSPTASATGTPPAASATARASATAAASATAEATATAEPTIAATRAPVSGSFRWANWVGYIDRERGPRYPTLERFTQETSVTVEYEQAVDDNESFYAADLAGPLGVGQPTGWDLVVLTDWMMQRLVTRGWLEQIDTNGMQNYPANLLDAYKTREWDPGNLYAAPWQSGMTGIGHDRGATGELDSLEVFWDPAYAGRMTYLSEMRDTIGLSALRLGFAPEMLTQEQFDESLAEVARAVNEGLVRQLAGNSYVDVMALGDAIVAIAWSGDVQGLLAPDQGPDQDFQWVLAREGGMLWTDNMGIPKGAVNKAQAEAWIDFYYRPEIAAIVEAWVNYVCPVKGAEEEMVALDPALAENTLIFPTPEMLARLHSFVSTDLDTAQRWEGAFADAIGL